MWIASIRPAELINASFFSLFVALAWLRRLPPRGRAKATLIGVAGNAVILAATHLSSVLPPPVDSIIRDWLPAPLMLCAYWQAGAFVGKPNDLLQNKLEDLDRRFLAVLPLTRLYRYAFLGSYLEFAYLLCYPMIPLGMGILYAEHLAHRAEQYWLAILPPTYLCHLTLPFASALPPRLLSVEQAGLQDRHSIRRLNLWILQRLSIRVISLPSAHVAMTMAASLVLLRLVPTAGYLFIVLSVSIAVGAVAGRYHYAVDVFLGGALAVLTYVLEVSYLF